MENICAFINLHAALSYIFITTAISMQFKFESKPYLGFKKVDKGSKIPTDVLFFFLVKVVCNCEADNEDDPQSPSEV